MPLQISRQSVKITYHNQDRSDYDPSKQDLDKWHETLSTRYKAQPVRQAMQKHGIAIREGTRSVVVMLAELSTGSTAGKRLDNACKYYAHVRPL